ncbi:MAG: hypothetical protein ABMA64_18260 [Myxococcota bacterium]
MAKNGLAILVLLAACGPKDWRAAVEADTSAAYLTYAVKNPTSTKLPLARRRAEQRSWTEAEASGTSVAYASYLSAFPAGDRAAEAQARAHELGWAEAGKDGTLAAYAAYVDRWPTSPHRGEAAAQVEELTYRDAAAEGTASAWGRYLLQYPSGKYAAAATQARDALIWAETPPVGTREAYQRYLDEFPAGAHADEARAWIAATYVTRIVPVVALVSSWQPRPTHAAVLARLRKGFDAEFVPELVQAGFEVLPTRAVDAIDGMKSAQEVVGIEPSTGVLVVEYRERAGRTFDPSGIATDAQVVLRLYAPNTAVPVWVRTAEATTPDKVRGSDVGALNQAAITALMEQLHQLRLDIASQRSKEAR